MKAPRRRNRRKHRRRPEARAGSTETRAERRLRRIFAPQPIQTIGRNSKNAQRPFLKAPWGGAASPVTGQSGIRTENRRNRPEPPEPIGENRKNPGKTTHHGVKGAWGRNREKNGEAEKTRETRRIHTGSIKHHRFPQISLGKQTSSLKTKTPKRREFPKFDGFPISPPQKKKTLSQAFPKSFPNEKHPAMEHNGKTWRENQKTLRDKEDVSTLRKCTIFSLLQSQSPSLNQF